MPPPNDGEQKISPKLFCPKSSCTPPLDHDMGGVQNVWGGAKRMGGGKCTRQRTLQKKKSDPSKRASGVLSLGFLYRKNRAATPEGGGKRARRRGSKTSFWERCPSRGFPPLSFFHPPMASSDLGSWTSARSGYGCPHPIWHMFFFQGFEGLLEVFNPGRPHEGRPREIQPENFLFGWRKNQYT